MNNGKSAIGYYNAIKNHWDKREIFVDIVGYGGLYKVSNHGRILSCSKKNSPQNNILSIKIDRDGYSKVGLSKNGKRKTFSVHRLVAKAFIPNPQNLATVNHKNFNKLDNNIKNLEWMSNCDNVRHAINNGRVSSGAHKLKIIKAKICTKCHVMKPIEDYPSGRGRGSVNSWCRGCEQIRQREYYLRKTLNENEGSVGKHRENTH